MEFTFVAAAAALDVLVRMRFALLAVVITACTACALLRFMSREDTMQVIVNVFASINACYYAAACWFVYDNEVRYDTGMYRTLVLAVLATFLLTCAAVVLLGTAARIDTIRRAAAHKPLLLHRPLVY